MWKFCFKKFVRATLLEAECGIMIFFSIIFSIQFWMEFYSVNNFILCGKYSFNFFKISYLLFIVLLLFESTQQLFLIPSLFYNLPRLSVVIFMYLLLRGTIRTFCKRVKDFLLHCTALCSTWCFSQRYTYRVLQTIQMKPILLCVWAKLAVLGSTKTALKFKYEI